MDYSEGYIAVYRRMRNSWIWDNAEYVKAWICIIWDVNWIDQQTFLDGKMITVKRGQAIFSIDTWAKKFGRAWSYQMVRTFFINLKTAQMINYRGIHSTTILTVCNYDTYQIGQQADNKPPTSQQQASNKPITTIKESNNINKYSLSNNVKNNLPPEWLQNDEFVKVFEICCQSVTESMATSKKKFTVTNATAIAMDCVRLQNIENAITALLYTAQSKSWNLQTSPPDFRNKQNYRNDRNIIEFNDTKEKKEDNAEWKRLMS